MRGRSTGFAEHAVGRDAGELAGVGPVGVTATGDVDALIGLEPDCVVYAASGPERDERGSLLELSWNGTEPLELADGSTRTFLEDGDEVVLTASAPGPDGARISFGEVTGRVEPARRD